MCLIYLIILKLLSQKIVSLCIIFFFFIVLSYKIIYTSFFLETSYNLSSKSYLKMTFTSQLFITSFISILNTSILNLDIKKISPSITDNIVVTSLHLLNTIYKNIQWILSLLYIFIYEQCSLNIIKITD